MARHSKPSNRSPSDIASYWLDHRLAGMQSSIRQRQRKHALKATAGTALLSGIGAYSVVTLEHGMGGAQASGVGMGLLAAGASLLTAAILYRILHQRERLHLGALSTITHSNVDLLSVLGKLTELRNGETAGHNLRVTLWTLMFAEALRLPPQEIVYAVKGALLHDVGKLAIPDSILGKPGPLTEEERQEMNKHVAYGLEIVSKSAVLQEAAAVVGAHHERYDGKGYPTGLAGEEIPRAARIFALMDVFDALTSVRVYKPAYRIEDALDIMAADRGTQFDPVLLDRFMELAPDFAYRLPHDDEAALATLLMEKLLPYLEFFIPDGAMQPAPAANGVKS